MTFYPLMSCNVLAVIKTTRRSRGNEIIDPNKGLSMSQALKQQVKICKFQKHLYHFMSSTNEISKILVLGYGPNCFFNFHIACFKFRLSHLAIQVLVKAAGESKG